MADCFVSNGKKIACEGFHPSGAGPHPAVLLLHGSGGGVPMMNQAGKMLSLAGFSAYVVQYFEATGHTWVSPQMIYPNFLPWLQSVQDAISHVTGQPGVDHGRVALVGFSLGAYLALAAATQDSRVRAVVDVFGGMPDHFAEMIRGGKVRQFPATLILHGEADPIVPVSEAHKLEALLKDVGAIYEIKTYPGQGHSLRGPSQMDALMRIHQFLARHLQRQAA